MRWGIVLLVWTTVFSAGMAAYLIETLPETDAWMQFDHRVSVSIRADNGAVIATIGHAQGENLHLQEIPKSLIDAVLATEDRRFYHHFGLDPVGLGRAAYVDIRSGATVQGGSTITQQLAKNVFLTPNRTFLRKIQEAVLALWIEHRYSKDQILEAYLNRMYFGASAYGVDAAAKRYFGISARRVDLAQSAVLAGLLRAPSRFSPVNDADRARARARQVLANMVAAGWLDPRAEAAAAAVELKHLAMAPEVDSGLHYFADWIQDEIADAGYHGDVNVFTTIDPTMQAAAEAAIAKELDKDGDRLGVTQGALVAMSPDGAIRAMVGGRDYAKSQFNRATQALRQPGSTFKLFVYLTALEHGYSPDSRFFDGPVSIRGWQPHDYEGGYRGDVTMSEAVAQSLNTVAAQVADKVGVANVIATARRLGVTDKLPADPSIALGTGSVTLMELTGAYAALARDGMGVWPFGVVSVRDADGTSLFQRSGSGPGQVIDPEVAEDMTGMLAGVIDHGTGRAAAIGRPAAGKTGTTSNFRDALFVGYTPELVAGVWFGNDDNTPMRHVTGGSLPARAWHDFMIAALRGAPARSLDQRHAPLGAFVSDRGPVDSFFHRAARFLGLSGPDD